MMLHIYIHNSFIPCIILTKMSKWHYKLLPLKQEKEQTIYKNPKHEANIMRKKKYFEKFCFKTVSGTASLMSIGSKFHRRGSKTEKASYPLQNGDFLGCGA